MKTKQFLIVVGVALVAFVVLLTLYDSNKEKPTDISLQQQEVLPSKENVSKNVQEKIDHLRRLAEKNPSDSKTIFELAQLLQDGHSVREAASYYARGLAVDKRNNAARIDYSLCLFEMGKSREALEQNMIVLRWDPANARASYNVGAIYANLGVADSARAYWSRLISLHPDDDLATKAKENMRKLSAWSSSS